MLSENVVSLASAQGITLTDKTQIVPNLIRIAQSPNFGNLWMYDAPPSLYPASQPSLLLPTWYGAHWLLIRSLTTSTDRLHRQNSRCCARQAHPSCYGATHNRPTRRHRRNPCSDGRLCQSHRSAIVNSPTLRVSRRRYHRIASPRSHAAVPSSRILHSIYPTPTTSITTRTHTRERDYPLDDGNRNGDAAIAACRPRRRRQTPACLARSPVGTAAAASHRSASRLISTQANHTHAAPSKRTWFARPYVV